MSKTFIGSGMLELTSPQMIKTNLNNINNSIKLINDEINIQKSLIAIDPEIPYIVISTQKISSETVNTYDLFLTSDVIDFIHKPNNLNPTVTARITNNTFGIAQGFFTDRMNIGPLVFTKQESGNMIINWDMNATFDFTLDERYVGYLNSAAEGDNNG